MIRANCRARFTAADFDFIVRTLARSRGDNVSLVDLLSDSESRDSILDHPKLVETILNNAGQLRISSQFYFYVLARHVLQQAGIGDRKLCDYVGSLLETFSRGFHFFGRFVEQEAAADEKGLVGLWILRIALLDGFRFLGAEMEI